MLSEVTGEDELNSRLDVVGADCVLLLVSVELGSIEGDSLEKVANERVHDVHSSLGDADVSVDVLQDSVDVDGVAVELLLSELLVSRLGDFLCRSLSGHLYIDI